MRTINLVAVAVVIAVLVGTPAFAQPRLVADVGQIALPVAALTVAAVLKDGDGVGDLAKSLVMAMAITHGLKATIDAERPNGGKHL